jgi:pimeloyl-ACP methyl ester carboxylesterase
MPKHVIERDVSDTKSVDLPSGVTIQYVEQGDPSGVPVLLLHGLSDSWRSFQYVLPHLPESIYAVAPSMRGHGDSERPEEGYEYSDFATDAAALMDALQIESAIIVGHSLGSSVAKRFAIDYPDRTRGVVLVASLNNWPANPAIQGFWEGAIKPMEDPVDPGFVREFQESTVAQPIDESYMDTIVQESLKVPARVWKATVIGSVEHDQSGELGKIQAPTLIIWGNQEELAPREDQDEQVEAIPNAELKVYEGVGHAVHWEAPERFASDLVGFIEANQQEKTTEVER